MVDDKTKEQLFDEAEVEALEEFSSSDAPAKARAGGFGAHSKPPAGSGAHSKPSESSGAHSKTGGSVLDPKKKRVIFAIAGVAAAWAIFAILALLVLPGPDTDAAEEPAQDVAAQPGQRVLDISLPEVDEPEEAVPADDFVNGTANIIFESGVPGSVLLDVPFVEQLPALPSGCEITAATSMLDYYGFEASNTELNEYLEQGWYYGFYDNPHERFVGYCAGEGWMAYPEPIVAALNGYLEAQEANDEYEAVDITGASPDDLYNLAREGTPSTVWVTTYLQDRTVMYTWYIDDEEFSASEQDHAMVLCGYKDGEVALVDPFGGLEWYPREDFEAAYDERGRMACIIEEK